MSKKLLPILLLTMALAACGSTKADEIGLHYNGGPFEGESFNRIVGPGSGQEFIGPSDQLYTLPLTVRTYEACADEREGDEGCDGPPIVTPAAGGGALAFSVIATFKVNTADEIIRSFFENVCRRYECQDDGEGWDEMLRVYFRGPIENALRDIAITYTVDELYAGVTEAGSDEPDAASVLSQVQAQLAGSLRDNINNIAGGNYFCGPTFNRNEPDTCPEFEFLITDVTPISQEVLNAYENTAASAQRVTAAENEAQATVVEATGEEEAARILSSLAAIPGYIELLQAQAMQQCAANPECTLVFTPGDTNVNVGTGPE